MAEDAELRGTTTLDGFRVLWVGVKREPRVFTVATLGAVLFGVLTVADAWVLGWSTQHVLIPAFDTGEIGTDLLVWVFVAVHVGGDPARDRHRRATPRRRHHVLPDAVAHAARRHPAVPRPPDGVAPAPPDRPAALQRLLRRRGGVVADHAAPDGARHRRDDGRRGRADVRRRRRDGDRRAARLPGRRGRQPALPALRLAADDAGAGPARRGQRDRARVLRRRDGGQDPGPRGRGDRPVPRQGRRSCATSTSAPAGSARSSTPRSPACPASACSSCWPSASPASPAARPAPATW